MRKLIMIAAACSVFGGTIGALVTAATQSEADPKAIAAAMQRVQDQRSEKELGNLVGISRSIRKSDDAVATTLGRYGSTRASIRWMENELWRICLNTDGSGTSGPQYCPTPEEQ